MSNEKDRILSYKLSTPLKPSDLESVSGGSSVQTVGTQHFVSTQGGDTSIAFDNLDSN